jgi:hypothetical protein
MPRDLYRTFDPRALVALAPHLQPGTEFVEPCAGAYDLAAQLVAAGHWCMDASDIKPLSPGIRKADALKLKTQPYSIITNPPWSRKLLHEMILHFITAAPEVWLLFDADWIHTQQAMQFLPYLRKVVSIGRLRWIPGTKMDGKDNCCFYLFDNNTDRGTQFYGRRAMERDTGLPGL